AVSGKAMKVLTELGLHEESAKLPHGDICGVIFSSPSGKSAKIDFPSSDPVRKGTGYCCRRELHDNLLFQNAKKYAKTIEGFAVNELVWEGERVVGVKGMNSASGSEEEYRAKVVVGADGVGSVVARKTGRQQKDTKHLCQAFRGYYKNVSGTSNNMEIHFVKSVIPGYFWIFPLDGETANVGIGMITEDVAKKKINLKQAMLEIIENNPMFKERFANAQLIGEIKAWTLPFGSKIPQIYGDGFLLLGDAASLVDPFSGEGQGNAMTSASVAARVIAVAIKQDDVSAKYLFSYQEELLKEIKAELDTSYTLQRLGRVTWILNLIVEKAARNKEVRDTISGMLANQEAKKEFMSPAFYLKLIFS
ncbi:hypothetical protein COV61_02515, partial [Candidatus Micrarchaeota archaeon CG11_big_fil_rev_8_21_14_0_20_47_5]